MICYLILHYKNIDETEKCINSILNITQNSSIVIVDNGSGNHTGKMLEKKYKDNPQIIVLLLSKNVGFSKGNNYGYEWIKYNLDVEFIVVANNDVVFNQSDFEKKIEDIYKDTKFDILGPDIYIPKHRDHQNPLFKKGITLEDLNKEIEQYKYYQRNPKKFMYRLRIHAIKDMLCSHSNVIRVMYSKLRGIEKLDYRYSYENVGLQGSCLIISKNFIDSEKKMFTPEPFLYEEEVFLFYKCQEKKYKMLYSPKLYIRHEEGASFSFSNKSSIDKIEFMLEHHVKAREMLKEFLKEKE